MKIDREFYQKTFSIILPIIIQNTVSNLVSLLDNLMVGRLGTDPMNAVSISNQLIFVYILCLWGCQSGGAIFTSQFYGKNNHEGVRDTFRAKIVFGSVITIAAILVFLFAQKPLVALFLHKTDFIGDIENTAELAKNYLYIMLIGLVPLSVSMAYTNTLRSIGQTIIPMVASISAVFVNLGLNYVLIFGHFGLPAMGIEGAAIATVVSRFVEAGITIFWTHAHPNECRFIRQAYKTLKIPSELLRQIIIKGTPLALNETLWSAGLTFLNQNYSLRGLQVVAAVSICSTILNLFNVFLFAVGDSISIIVGQLLGAGKEDEARSAVKKLTRLSFFMCIVIAAVLALLRNIFPSFYNTEEEVRSLASVFILISAGMMPVLAVVHACYFTLRCGGKTAITFIFDSGFVWVFSVTTAFILTRYTALPIVTIYLIVQSLDLIKVAIGLILVKKGVWIQNLT